MSGSQDDVEPSVIAFDWGARVRVRGGRAPLVLAAGDGFVLPSHPGHAGRNAGAEPARMFIVDALVPGG